MGSGGGGGLRPQVGWRGGRAGLSGTITHNVIKLYNFSVHIKCYCTQTYDYVFKEVPLIEKSS